jgi:hypothetical protein
VFPLCQLYPLAPRLRLHARFDLQTRLHIESVLKKIDMLRLLLCFVFDFCILENSLLLGLVSVRHDLDRVRGWLYVIVEMRGCITGSFYRIQQMRNHFLCEIWVVVCWLMRLCDTARQAPKRRWKTVN